MAEIFTNDMKPAISLSVEQWLEVLTATQDQADILDVGGWNPDYCTGEELKDAVQVIRNELLRLGVKAKVL